jgi:hypothetical protein
MIFHSSNTWVGANASKPYVETSTSRPTGDNVVRGLEFVFMGYTMCVESFEPTVCFVWLRKFQRQVLLGSPIRLELIDCRNHWHIGIEVIEQLTIGLDSSLVIFDQWIGAANNVVGYCSFYFKSLIFLCRLQSNGFNIVDGIIG